ncbi:MAG: ABC transporter ATP-binding protein [Candidatus Omnitrophota bacterium]|jgi:iron(III) transport system ATP-binding protein|nr:MAG: ABC transporter ATP-binding protein [Candidatus Omnitrophota bacterium]
MSSNGSNKQSDVKFDGVSMAYGAHQVLQRVCFTAPAGKITVLFGPSGVGKTTCLRLIAGFERPLEGTVSLADTIVSSPDFRMPPRDRRIGFCFQNPALWPALNVRKHLEIVMKKHDDSSESKKRQIDELLDIFGLTPAMTNYPDQLSGGEQKRLEFARALAMNPDILLLDEPLASVEGLLREALMRLTKLCRLRGMTVLSVTHQLEEAFSIADHMIILHGGRALRSGSPHEIFHAPGNRRVAELMGYRNFFHPDSNSRTIQTLFGCWPHPEAAQVGWLTILPDDLRAEECETGEGRVDTCYFAGRYFHCRIAMRESIIEATSDHFLSKGTRVNLRALNTPVLLGEE